MASFAALSSLNVTNANPRGRPVSRSVGRYTSLIEPACEKSVSSSSRLVLKLRFPKKTLEAIKQRLRSAALPCRRRASGSFRRASLPWFVMARETKCCDACQISVERSCKPNSVLAETSEDHSSAARVTAAVEQPTRKLERERAVPSLPYLVFLRSGFAMPPPLTRAALRSYPTLSPLPPPASPPPLAVS